MIDEGLAIRRKVFGESSVQVAGALTIKANLLLETGQYSDANAVAAAAHEVFAAQLPEGHWRTAMAESAEGAALVGLKAYDEAETLLLKSHEILSDSAMGMALLAEQSHARLYELYTVWGKPEEASKYRNYE